LEPPEDPRALRQEGEMTSFVYEKIKWSYQPASGDTAEETTWTWSGEATSDEASTQLVIDGVLMTKTTDCSASADGSYALALDPRAAGMATDADADADAALGDGSVRLIGTSDALASDFLLT
jgi:hypothetical protein